MQLENHRAAILQVSSVGVHSVQKDVYNKQTKDQVGLKEDATIICNCSSRHTRCIIYRVWTLRMKFHYFISANGLIVTGHNPYTLK